jgi:membrane-bound serine protease (ClpP class)
VLLVDGPIPELRVSIYTALAVSLPFGAIAIFLMTLVARSYQSRVTTGIEGMIGEIGVARTRIDGQGKVFVHGETWNATSVAPIEPGTKVRVNAVDGLRVDVTPVGVLGPES